MKNIRLIYISLIFALTLMNCKGSKSSSLDYPQSSVNWIKKGTLTEITEKAKLEDKLIFIDFYTSWCRPCKMMDRDVFSDKDISTLLNENFINFKVNAEKGSGPNLAFTYKVRAYPTLVFLDQNGKVLARKEGVAYERELTKLANLALIMKSGS